jgi:hypothetical protein
LFEDAAVFLAGATPPSPNTFAKEQLADARGDRRLASLYFFNNAAL